MRFGTICSGIGAPEVAWSDFGWHQQFAAEIEPFPCAVHSLRFPKVKNYGDRAPPAIAFTERTRSDDRNFEASEELSFALTNPGSGGRTHSRQIAQGWAVRRLTPRECERLQGFPDDFTLIPWRGKAAELCPDGPRYKAIGNSMAVPVLRWIGNRIKKLC